jgi:protein TonB
MRIPLAMAAVLLTTFFMGGCATQNSSQDKWHTFQSDDYNSRQLDIANVKRYGDRIVYPLRHLIGRHTAQFVIVGDCARKKRKEIFNSSLSLGPYVVDPVLVADLELNDVVDGSNADIDLRAACNWVNDGKLETPLSSRIAALENTRKELLAQRSKSSHRSMSSASPDHMQRLETEIEKRISEHNERPKKFFISPATREVGFAMYYHQVAEKIEKVGTCDFPKSAGKSLYGKVIVSIPIFHDGSIYEKDGGPVVERSSGIPVLDQAALNIVRKAAPYGVFPRNMRTPDRDDVWVITTTFDFTKTDESENEPTPECDESGK